VPVTLQKHRLRQVPKPTSAGFSANSLTLKLFKSTADT
jgi:hypothetical protein